MKTNCQDTLPSRIHCLDLETAYNHGAKKLDKALNVSSNFYFDSLFSQNFNHILYNLWLIMIRYDDTPNILALGAIHK